MRLFLERVIAVVQLRVRTDLCVCVCLREELRDTRWEQHVWLIFRATVTRNGS